MKTSFRYGFTLLEVMVALVIIGISMVIILSTQVNSTRSYTKAKVMTISSMLARKKLAELEAGEYPEPCEESGMFDDNDNYRWTLLVRETDLEELREVILDVYLAPEELDEKPGIPGVTVVTYLADPGKPEEEEEDEEGEQEGG